MEKLDITSTAIEKGLDMVKGFVEKLAGGAIEEAGLIFAENVRIRRLKNQLKILEKAKKIAEESNIDIKQVNLKILVPLLENCSLEEEDTLQDMWANLLVNYADSCQDFDSNVFPYILSQISSKEAFALSSASGKVLYNDQTLRFNLDNSQLNNLVRLGLLTHQPKASIKQNNRWAGDNQYVKFEKSDDYTLTSLAREFIFCCSKKE